MARKIVDIGVEGNDGTGDSIREGFRKVNENFKEIYAVFGQEGTLAFLNLGDVEAGQLKNYSAIANQLPIVNSQGSGIKFKPMVGANGLTIAYPDDPADPNYNKIVLTQQRSTSELGSADIPGKFGNVVDGQGFLLGNIADPTQANVLNWNSGFGRSGQTVIGAEKFPVPLGFADNRYINKGTVAGEQADAMVGYLSVPAGASGDQVAQAAETVLKAGATMTGKLFLSDHPGDLAGAGNPLGVDDKQAATKYYVDTTAYSSKVNLYVSSNGDDSQVKTPPGKEGRAFAYAFQSLVAACLKAEQLIDDSPWETGPYRQLIAYGGGKYYSEIVSGGIIIGGGLNGTTRIKFNNDSGSPVDQGVANNKDIIPGKIVVGRNSGARGFIVKYGTIDNTDYVDLRDVTGSFETGENLFFDQAVKRLEISIFIESGTYYEDYPIRIPRNCSILGDEFRRTVIRPADRVSKSPWAGTWFYRDLEFDNLKIAETNWGYHYLTDPTNKASTPKNNKDIDVFLCNDATIIRQISAQGHGGFMMVLDPNGQILTKSPYCQQSGCFSGSLNKQAFRGGQYVDGQAGSMPVTTVSANFNQTEITVTDAFRVPQTPTAFFVKGKRYKVDTFTDNGLGYRGARELLLLNKEFIVAETIAYVNDVVTPTFVYDAIQFSIDVGKIVNAVAWDIVLDSNIQSILFAESYVTLPSQKSAILVALNYVKDSLSSLLSSNATAAARARAKMDIIIQIITYGVEDRTILDASSWSYDGTTISVTKSSGHGLGAGWSVKIVDATASTNAPNGVFNVASVVNDNTFTYVVTNAPTGTAGGTLRFTSSPIPIRSIPNPPVDPQALPATTAGIQNSLALLIANRELIKAEYIAYIQTYYSDFLFGTRGVVGYIRDADRIVNAVIYDTIYGGTSQTVLVARGFFDSEGKSTISTEVTQIYNGLEWIRDVAGQVVTDTQITNLLQVSVKQVRGTAGTSAIATSVQDNFNYIITAIRFGQDTLPAVAYPGIENVATTLQSAKSLIDINVNTIRSNTIAFINSKYLYNIYAAQRDIRFLIDDLAHDIVYTGNLNMVEHGLGYFVGDAKLVSDAERPRTLAILDYLKQLALYVVDNKDIPSPQLVNVGALVIGQTYKINTVGSTVWTALGSVDSVHNTVFTATATGLVTAGHFVVGRAYTIVSRGNPNNLTNFINIGSPSNSVGTAFIATGVGTGTGTAIQGTGNARLASGSDFYRRQFAISQTIQLVSSGAGPATIVPSLTWVNTNLVNAFQRLETDKTAIEAAIVTWINNNIAGNTNNPGSIWYGFSYNSGEFSKTVGAIIDVVGYDMMFNSNFRSSRFGIDYYTANLSSLSTSIAAFGYLKNYLLSTVTSASYGDTANTRVGDKMDIILSILATGSGAVPAYLLPSPTGFDIDYSNAKRLISDNKAFIVDEITTWIAAQIAGNITPFTTQFQYDATAFSNGVSRVIDAILYDLTYGGNLETIVAANANFVITDTALGTGQKDKSIAAYARLEEVIGKVAQAVTVLDKHTAILQTTAVSGGGLTTSVAFAQARVEDIIKQLNITKVDSKPQLESLVNTTRTMVANTEPSTYIAAKDLLVANRSFIQAEVYNYLKYTYTFPITQTTNNQLVTASTAKMRVGMPVQFLGTDPFQVTILTASTPLLVDGKYVVTFEFARQRVRPDSTKDYEIQGNANGLYNLIVPVAIVPDQATTDTTTTSITVVYPFNPGVFDYANQTTIRVSGGTFGGVNRDAKYYVKEIKSLTNFTISETINGSTPGALFSLDSDTGSMYCRFAFDEATCRRDTGFLVSNISTDILYGGRYNTIKAGKRFLAASSVLVVTEQSVECRAGISYIDTLAQTIINNQAPLVNYQSLNNVALIETVTQTIDTTKVGGSAAGTTITGLVALVNNIILNGKTWTNDTNNIPDAVVYPKYVLQLNEETPYSTTISGALPDEIVMQAAGNTSMLSNDWTQLNDLAYGLVATNNGLIETVSVFTYYCWTAYYSRNGGQIRSVAGSNANGEYGLVAEGSDPFEVPDSVNLSNDMPQVARVYKAGPFSAEMAKTKTTVYIDTYNYLPYNVSEIEINHGYTIVDGAVTGIGITRYEVAGVVDASGTYFSTAQPTAGTPTYNSGTGKYRVQFTFPAKTYIPDTGRYYTITGNANTAYNNNLTGWLCVASDTSHITLEFTSVNPGTFSTVTATTLKLKKGTILRLNLNTSGSNSTIASGLQADLADNQLVVIRPNQNFKFYNVDNISPTRPSTALTFRGDPLDNASAPVYRVLAFGTKDPLSDAMTLTFNTIYNASSASNVITVPSTVPLRAGMTLSIVSGTGSLSDTATVLAITSDTTFTVSPPPAVALVNATLQAESPTLNDVILTFDSGYSYIGLVIDQDHNTLTEAAAGIDGGSTTRTLGSQIGDQWLAIRKINSAGELQRILTGQMCFGWNGRVHRISNYLTRTISSTEGYGIIQINEVTDDASRGYQDISGYGYTGITAPTRPGEGYNVTTATYDSDAQLITYTISGLETAPNTARFTGAISAISPIGATGGTLTVSSISSGTMLIGSTITGITGTSVTAGTRITAQVTCSAASIYNSSATGTSGSYTLTLSAGSVNILNGQFVSGNAAIIDGLPANTYVTNVSGNTVTLSNALTKNFSATVYFYTAGLAGIYAVDKSQTVSSQAMGVHYTVYGNSNASYDIAGPILTSTYQSLTIAAAKATVVGTVSGLYLTVNYVSGNTIQLGQSVSGTGLNAGTYIVSQSSGTAGGAGVYLLNTVANIVTPTFTGAINNLSSGAGNVLTVSAVASGTILVGADIQKTAGSGVTAGTTITGQLTGVTAFTTTATGTQGTFILTVASVGTAPAGVIKGQLVTGSGIPNDTYVSDINLTGITLTRALTGNATGGTYTFATAGSTGTYSVDTSQLATSGEMKAVFIAIPGAFGSTSATRIFPTEKLYNPSLVQDNTITIRTGLSAGEPADIIVNISTCRVTGHDFSDIGTGGYNQSNYPNKVYGPGKAKNQKKEVAERGTGRVFWVATDQDGFFRVGRFFTVDQGTGTVTFAASLALSNLDGLGFKRGRAINEFSDDDTFQDLSDTKVPTEHAIDGYLNRRLGIDRNNIVISEGTLGAGFLDRNGILEMNANLRLGGHYVENLGEITPTTPFNYAVTKRYVDGQQMSDASVDVDGHVNNDLLIYNYDRATPAWVNARSSSPNSQIYVELIADKELDIRVKRETISNSQVREDANISQNKVDINVANEQRDQGVLLSSVQLTSGYVVATADAPTGKSPHCLVKLSVNGTPTALSTNIWYTVSGNSNLNYNGKFLCVSSSPRVGGANAYVILEYPENPGVFGGSTTTVTPWETTVTTQLDHGLVAGDNILITDSVVASVSLSATGSINSRQLILSSQNSGIGTGQLVTGIGIPDNTYVVSVDQANVTLSEKLTKAVNGVCVFASNINGNWLIKSVPSTNSFVISLDTRLSGAFTLTTARATKLGLSTFNKNQFAVTNGFVSLETSSTDAVTAAINANSNIVTISSSDMAKVSVGHVITIRSNASLVTIPTTALANPTGIDNGVQPQPMTVTAITSATTFTVSVAFSGSGSAASAILNIISGVPLSSLQQVETDSIIGNLSGSRTSPNTVTSGQIVKAGDGIKNIQFNDDLLADVNVRGIMSIIARDTVYPHKNTYGVWNVTKTGAGNSVVRTTNEGAIEATQYILDGKKAIDTSSGANIDFFTPGLAKFLTANGNDSVAAAPTISIGTFTTAVNTSATSNTNGAITVVSIANMYIGQELSFSGTPFGGISVGTYYIVSINSGSNTISISTSDTLSPVFTGTTANGSMTVTGTITNPGVLNGQVYVPNLKAYGTVTFNPINANISLQPRSTNGSTGTITMFPAVNGSINNMAIGALSESTGKFTTVEITSVTDAVNSTTGPLKVAGGAAIAKKLFVGGNFEVTGNALVTGDLTVKGVTTTVNSNTVNIADKNIVLAGVTTSPRISCDIDSSGTVTNMLAENGLAITGLIPGMVITKDGTVGPTNNAVLGTGGAVATIATIISPTSITITVSAGSITAGKLIFTAAGGNDTTGDGGGITVKAAADKTIIWVAATNRWTTNVGIETPNITVTNGFGADTVTAKTLIITDNTTLGNANTDTITVNSQFVNGTQLKTAQTAGNTLNISAYDTNDTVYRDLIKVTAGDTPYVTINSNGLGTIDGIDIGQTSEKKGKFSILATTDTTTFGAAVTMTTANKTVTFSPTGTGTVSVEPAAALSLKSTGAAVTITSYTTGNMDGIAIGVNNAKDGTFANLTSTGAVQFTRNGQGTTTTDIAHTLKVTGGAGFSGNVYAAKFYGAFEVPAGSGTIKGQIDGADQVKTVTASDGAGPYYVAFVNSNNGSAANSTVYTDGSLSYNASTNTLTTDNFVGTATKATNLTGGSLGSIHYQTAASTSGILAPNTSTTPKYLKSTGDGANGTAPSWTQIVAADIGDFATAVGSYIGSGTTIQANAATASKWATARTISFTGGATGSVSIDGSANVSCQLTLGAAAADTVKITEEATTGFTRYLTFTSQNVSGQQGSMSVDGDLTYKPSTNTLTSTYFAGTASSANYGDLAEKYLADAEYEEGTVLVFGGDEEVTQSTVFNDRRVAGVISLKAAYTMNNDLSGDHVAVVALQGRVPVKVIGRVQKGDMLVTSGKPGYAIVNNDPRVGTVIGKALAVKTTDGEGVVEAVVGKH